MVSPFHKVVDSGADNNENLRKTNHIWDPYVAGLSTLFWSLSLFSLFSYVLVN